MNLKIELVERASRGEPLAALCREFGISRTTRHKWVKRFRDLGYEGLEDRSKRPKNTPLATAEDVVIAVLELREAHPRWGPKKLQVVLQRRLGNDTPSERTIARILDRAGRVRERQRRRSISVVDRIPRVEAKEPNDVWTVDFKGWWRARNTQRCEPLTVRDAWSRFVLASVIVENTKTDTACSGNLKLEHVEAHVISSKHCGNYGQRRCTFASHHRARGRGATKSLGGTVDGSSSRSENHSVLRRTGGEKAFI